MALKNPFWAAWPLHFNRETPRLLLHELERLRNPIPVSSDLFLFFAVHQVAPSIASRYAV